MVSGGGADLRIAGSALIDRRPFVIFNPASGRGRGARRLGLYRELLDRHLPGHAVGITEHPGHEATLADRAMDAGHDLIIAVGGDGTWSHVADRVGERGSEVALAVLPAGTGNDFGRNLGLSFGDPEAAVRAIASGRERRVDLGRVVTPSYPTPPGARTAEGSRRAPAHRIGPEEPARPRHFLNVIGIGFDVAVIDAAASARLLTGALLYKLTALRQLFGFPGIRARIATAGEAQLNARHLMMTVTNGCYFGGGFPIAPEGRIDDGRLHGCFIEDAPPWTRLTLFARAERGRHVGDARVTLRSSRGFRFEFDAPVRFEADGDTYATEGHHLELEVKPGALLLRG
ncbi:MAG: YegS/Rv2252/BmrU family lipid kinase [Longimicrobiales bacterium]|nr:YegS/Rv2252/BmrU family lipid kinase [Longimicrobiales bacterium]